MVQIKEAKSSDFEIIWPLFLEVAQARETYAFAPDVSKQEAFSIWMKAPLKTFIAEEDGRFLGTYYLKTNHAGPGSHVCNCGYMVNSQARGKGVATMMCEHSQQLAKQLGYMAMQFNFVATSNVGAIKLWLKLGFDEVGRLPKAFNHPKEGYIDALVMYKLLV